MKPILFWLGAGKASSIKLNPSDYEMVILVEAQSVLCDKLKEKYQSYEQVEVINACLAPDSSESAKQFNVFNVNESHVYVLVYYTIQYGNISFVHFSKSVEIFHISIHFLIFKAKIAQIACQKPI